MRINKYIAEAGVCSRRAADKLIADGAVKVNGRVCRELGKDINIYNDSVTVNGVRAVLPSEYTYIMFNKPKGCVTTSSDDKGRKTIFDYINIDKRLFSVGRLDYDTEGLLLLTDDGELAYKLTHPSHEIDKTYHLSVEGEVKEGDLAVLRKGVEIDGVKTKPCRIKFLEFSDGLSKIEITIHEGRNRQIRKMFESKGYNIVFLRRISVGNLRLGGLGRCMHRPLRDDEILYLKKL